VVACNLSDDPATVEGVHGTIRIASDRTRDDEPVDGTLHLGPWHAAIVFVPST
jgi:hypothetical protein